MRPRKDGYARRWRANPQVTTPHCVRGMQSESIILYIVSSYYSCNLPRALSQLDIQHAYIPRANLDFGHSVHWACS
jgi:hypothetical protein